MIAVSFIDALDNGSTDNCTESGDLTFSLSGPALFTCADAGIDDGVDNIVTRTLTVTDCTGNTNTCDLDFRILPIIPNGTDSTEPATCSDVDFTVTLQDNINDTGNGGNAVAETSFSYTVVYDTDLTQGGGDNAGPVTTIEENLENLTSGTLNATYTVTPTNTVSGCVGATFTVIVPINPEPVLADIALATCSGDRLDARVMPNTDDVIPESSDNGIGISTAGGGGSYEVTSIVPEAGLTDPTGDTTAILIHLQFVMEICIAMI